jgi:hypothetical protein
MSYFVLVTQTASDKTPVEKKEGKEQKEVKKKKETKKIEEKKEKVEKKPQKKGNKEKQKKKTSKKTDGKKKTETKTQFNDFNTFLNSLPRKPGSFASDNLINLCVRANIVELNSMLLKEKIGCGFLPCHFYPKKKAYATVCETAIKDFFNDSRYK